MISRVLETHIANSSVCEQACWAMQNMASNNDKNRIKLSEAGCCEMISRVLETHIA
ncbi:MAG: hypothetical protein ACK56F_05965, partial [bacterium]